MTRGGLPEAPSLRRQDSCTRYRQERQRGEGVQSLHELGRRGSHLFLWKEGGGKRGEKIKQHRGGDI